MTACLCDIADKHDKSQLTAAGSATNLSTNRAVRARTSYHTNLMALASPIFEPRLEGLL